MDMDIIRLWKVKPLQDSACVRRENYRQEGGDSTACSTATALVYACHVNRDGHCTQTIDR